MKPIIPESDSEEDGPLMKNTVGNVPMEWYKDEKHIGYDLSGKKIMRKPRKDTLDAHLARSDDPEAWRSVYDEVNDEELRLTDAEVKLLRRLRAGKFDPGFDPYADYPDPVDAPEHKVHPLSSRPEPKSRFVPSKHEAKMVVKYVRLIRAGKLLRPKPAAKPEQSYNFDLWSAEGDAKHRGAVPIPAPKPKLPGHAESYHPPKEYLLTPEEEEAMLRQDPSDRPMNFLPRDHAALRRVPLYGRLLHERFERCLDLYLCPRAVKKRMNVDPDSLVPKLPRPQELKPYPVLLTVQYDGHTGKVNALAVHPAGQYLASGADDGTVRLWEVATGRCCRTWRLGGADAAAAPPRRVTSVSWNPCAALNVIAAAVGHDAVLLDAGIGGGPEAREGGREVLERGREAAAGRRGEEERKDLVQWAEAGEAEREEGVLLTIQHSKPVIQVAAALLLCGVSCTRARLFSSARAPARARARAWPRALPFADWGWARARQVSWHHKGDYLVTLAPTANTRAILIHQLSRRQTQNPFSKSKADAQRVLFHPSKPFLFVATMRGVRVYSLLKQARRGGREGARVWESDG